MADYYNGITDHRGNPIEKKLLTEEISAASLTGVRSPITSYPGDGLNPGRLAAILKEADQGDPVRYLELAETIEERNPHYQGVLGTRKRSVSQLEITVEAGGEDSRSEKMAQMVRDWLTRDELCDELFDMLDAVGKGYSFTEIIWDTSAGQWRPDRLEWRDPRWFRFDRIDGTTPKMIDENGQEQILPGFKFVYMNIKAKSGLPLRSGIARVAAWNWMFKAFTERDWAIFTQNYGQPIRVGKYGAGSTKEDRDKLYRAVANIAGDCAAIIPESMIIEFIEAKSGGTSHNNYKERADWLDQQMSKAVLGQTATTDAVTGGLGSGKEHRQVQEDIERADAKAATAIVNRDLIRPWIDLEYGPQKAYPRVRIGRAEQQDVEQIINGVTQLVPFGLQVGKKQMLNVIGLSEPDKDDELLLAPATGTTERPDQVPAEVQGNTGEADEGLAARQADESADVGEAIAEAAGEEARPSIDAIVKDIRGLIERASTPEEAAVMLQEAIDRQAFDAPPADLEDAVRQALLLAELTGREQVRR